MGAPAVDVTLQTHDAPLPECLALTALLRDLSHLENLTMRSFTLTGAAVLAAALLTGCGSDSDPTAANTAGALADATRSQTVDHFSINEPFPGAEVFVNPCNGETIQFTGTLVGQVTSMDTHYELHIVISATGTGLTTGAAYTFYVNQHESFNSPTPEALNFTYRFLERDKATSTTPGLSFAGHSYFNFVALPDGTFKITRDSDQPDECTG
jgi:hypothetical protein